MKHRLWRMMRGRAGARLPALPLALMLLLSGCQAGSAAAPAPGQDAGPEVAVHWDVLESGPVTRAERFYEEYTDHLIASDSYGELVPYIGGEAYRDPLYGVFSPIYGLATHDGTIVTDPVYLDVSRVSMYDSVYSRSYADTLVLCTTVPIESEPENKFSLPFEYRYGFAAPDGSWYTGQEFRYIICTSEAGMLCFDAEDNVVMLDLSGRALFRWEAGAIPLENFTTCAHNSASVRTDGPYMIYLPDLQDVYACRYVDLRDGTISAEKPEGVDWPRGNDVRPSGHFVYSGGEFSVIDGVMTVRPYSGGEYSLPSPVSALDAHAVDISGDRILCSQADISRLYDFEGHELRSWDTHVDFVYQKGGGESSLLYSTNYVLNDEGTMMESMSYTVYDLDGNELMTVPEQVIQFGDRLLITEEDCYRLTDLEGTDLICISRWTAMDIPAEW